jgi:hypothetical protein
MTHVLIPNMELECALRLLVACVCGALIGFERTKRYKGAGIRTHMIVALGAALFVIVSRYGFIDVVAQEGVISEALDRVTMIAGQYSELKTNKNYVKYMNAVDSYEKMIRISRLIYNDSVSKFNRELRMFPTSLFGRIFGFSRRNYMETAQEKIDMPSAE